MGFISSLKIGLNAIIKDLNKPESFKKGDEFENYVRANLFIANYYDLVHMTHDYNTNQNDFVEETKEPDYLFRDKKTKKEFYLEVKFRANLFNGKIEWCKDYQLKRYQEFNKKTPVFVIIGHGGISKMPESIYLLPLGSAKYTGLFPNYAKEFSIDLDRPVTSKYLWNIGNH